ncbi:hypothetical protein HETIRDRAFT_380117 [Heterobasidion irregulare TC 32-1]|uniref:Uncharacterized protein n=1 Tax=Heterobasidion irregulare (strain TC 32-1) TaxID=747525 RepID=W4KJR1_HETIT|nr:uncharacterized protein HETIRDRAFT_380117 [Heterobasidion irregulare TC 32-1]ETW85939.1 hypothetical protein HETIRDRAFT_380117 [Heterobasidion irregulare TC 32-1]
MYPRIDAPSDFDYPVECLLKLRGILSAEDIRTPNNKDHNGNLMQYVIKRGHTTLTTIGCLNGFESHVRRYFTLGSRDSVEAVVYPYDNDSGPFSRGGDRQTDPPTSRLGRQCIGSGTSSRLSSPVPTSLSMMITTRPWRDVLHCLCLRLLPISTFLVILRLVLILWRSIICWLAIGVDEYFDCRTVVVVIIIIIIVIITIIIIVL